jgi:hypothetical protein
MILENASGYRFVQQVGRAGFKAKLLNKSVATDFRRLVYGSVQANKGPLGAAKTAQAVKAVWPYLTATMFTTGGLPTARKVIVQRASCNASSSALAFCYNFIGF